MAANRQVAVYIPMGGPSEDFQPFSGTTPFPGFHGLHCHDFFEFYIFFAGAGHYCIDDHVCPLKPCTLAVVPPSHLHGLLGDKQDLPYDRAWLNVSTAMVRNVSMVLSGMDELFTGCLENGRAFCYIELKQALELRGIIEDIRGNIEDRSPEGKWRNELRVALYLSKIYDILRDIQETNIHTEGGGAIRPVLAYINDHYTESIAIPELSRRFGISASHMSREFTAYTGRSVYDYVLYRRIQLARELIYLGKPFSEIAFECGFNDYSCFLRAFVKLTGQTPSAYRKYISSMGNIV